MLKNDTWDALKFALTIPTNTLDNALSQQELLLPDMLKIDIEGAEGLCIRGAKRLLSGALGKTPRLIHPDFMAALGMSAAQLQADMLASGYTVTWQENRYNQIHLLYKSI